VPRLIWNEEINAGSSPVISTTKEFFDILSRLLDWKSKFKSNVLDFFYLFIIKKNE